MLNEFKEWTEALLGTEYSYSMGQWIESKENKRYCVIQASGGRAVDVDDRCPRYRVVLIGRRGERFEATKLMSDANTLIEASISEAPPCGSSSIRAMSEPTGPGYTVENRAWTQIDFELIF